MSKEYMYIIRVGSLEDWERGLGSLYWIEDRKGERCMPVFTTREGVERFIEANFSRPESHMQMLESIAGTPSHAEPLTAGRFVIMPVDEDLLIRTALRMGIDYLQRDIRPGAEQEILRLS